MKQKLAETFVLNDFVLEFKARPSFMQETTKSLQWLGGWRKDPQSLGFKTFPLSDPIWQLQTSLIKFVLRWSHFHTFAHRSLSLLSNSEKHERYKCFGNVHCLTFSPIGDKDKLVSRKPQNDCRCCLQLTSPTLLWLLATAHDIPRSFWCW